MVRNDLKKMANNTKVYLSKHHPEITMGIGLAGLISATVVAVRATPKALKLIEEKKEELEKDKLEPIETIKATWKCYIPTVVLISMSSYCIIYSNSISARRNAALATAYRLSESALKEYKDKVVETIGEKKEETIRDSIAKDKIEKDPVTKHEIIFTGQGNTLCYDSLCGRYFYSDMDSIKKAVNELNRQMLDDMYVSLNDLYYLINLKETECGDILGWNMDHGFVDVDFSSQLSEDGTPCLVMSYSVAPVYEFYHMS